MKVRAGGAAGGADEAHKLAAGYLIAYLHVDAGKVAVAGDEAVSVVELDHIAVAALPACLGDGAACRCDHQIAAFAVDVHPGMEFVCAAAERVTAEAELIIDFAGMRPDGRDVCRIASGLDQPKLFFDRDVLGIHAVRIYRAAAVDGEIVDRIGARLID